MKRKVRVYKKGCAECDKKRMQQGGPMIDEAAMRARGLENPCAGVRFGGPDCPKGSMQYEMAKSFRKESKPFKPQSSVAPMNENIDEVTSRKSKDFQSFLTYNSRKAIEEDEQFNAAYDFLRYGGPKAQFGQEMYNTQPIHGYTGLSPMMQNAISQQQFQENQDLQAMNSLFSNKIIQDGAKTVGGLAVSGAKAIGRGIGSMFGSKAYGGPVKKYQTGGPIDDKVLGKYA